jgi:hypothetical protein
VDIVLDSVAHPPAKPLEGQAADKAVGDLKSGST